jgi:phosphoadenosine phosphosulfate reductase
MAAGDRARYETAWLMPLLSSPRHTAADLAVWAERERVDAVLAHTPVMDRRETRALAVLARSAAAGPCYVSVSWGKDSTCVAHLAWLLAQRGGPVLPLAYARTTIGIPDPEAPQLADAFAACWPGLPYRVVPVGAGGLPELHTVMGCGRYVSGVRAAESGRRRLSARVHGVATARACRPLLRWSAGEVFAYLHRHGLPVHPAYGMSEGGAWDRDLLRVHSLGAGLGAGSEEWERRYYPDVVGRG